MEHIKVCVENWLGCVIADFYCIHTCTQSRCIFSISYFGVPVMLAHGRQHVLMSGDCDDQGKQLISFSSFHAFERQESCRGRGGGGGGRHCRFLEM